MHKTYNTIDYFMADEDERREYVGVWTYSDMTDAPSRDIYGNLAICENRDTSRGRYYLILNRSEFLSDDLPQLESHLLEWAKAEGYDLSA